jgi:hypothetical protein
MPEGARQTVARLALPRPIRPLKLDWLTQSSLWEAVDAKDGIASAGTWNKYEIGSEMLPSNDDFLIKRFEQPDEVRAFEKGKFETVKIGSMTIGRASYEPGWKWSTHVGAAHEEYNNLIRQLR